MVPDNIDNISYRAVIHYRGLKGLTPKEIHVDMVVSLGENAPSYSMVKKWAAEFRDLSLWMRAGSITSNQR